MGGATTLDAIVKHKLRSWPQHPPGLDDQENGRRGAWLRGRPGRANEVDDPFLKFPGSNRMRTIPDGLWLCFGGSEREVFVDIFVIEVCGSVSNLLDKRGRFTPSMHSLLAVCPVALAARADFAGQQPGALAAISDCCMTGVRSCR